MTETTASGAAQGGQSRGGQGWDDTAEDPNAAQTRADYGYPSGVPNGDAYQQVFTPPQDSAYAEEDPSNFAAFNQVEEEEPAPARSDGNSAGIPLDWDDE